MLNWVTPQICFEQQSCKMAKTREVIIILMLFCCTIICTVLSRFIAQFETLFIVVIAHTQSMYCLSCGIFNMYCALHICIVLLYLCGIFTTHINSTGEMQSYKKCCMLNYITNCTYSSIISEISTNI